MNDPKSESDDLVTEFMHELKFSFGYDYKGDRVNAQFITLTAPSVKTPHRADLKQCFFRAANNGPSTADKKIVDSDSEKKPKAIDGGDIISMIAMSNDVSLSVFLEYGKILLTSGVALVDGETKLTKPLVDSMNPEELENIIGDYMANFILASALKKLKDDS